MSSGKMSCYSSCFSIYEFSKKLGQVLSWQFFVITDQYGKISSCVEELQLMFPRPGCQAEGGRNTEGTWIIHYKGWAVTWAKEVEGTNFKIPRWGCFQLSHVGHFSLPHLKSRCFHHCNYNKVIITLKKSQFYILFPRDS